MSGVNIVNLVKRFGSTEAVNGVSLEVKSGDLVVMLGPSGCGKTTTLRCVAGLETPDEGDVFVDGVRVNELPLKDRDMAMVFQNYALYPHMPVYNNIAFPLKMRKKSKSEIEARVHEVARLLNIEHLLMRKPRQLSGGEQQRTALARALIRKPKVFLMDEPLSNLDAKLRLYTRTEIKKLQQELRITTIYVTHDQAEAMALADKIAIMNQGRIAQYDTPESIYGKPVNTFVAGFVGSPPMNLVKASIREKGTKIAFDAGFFSHELTNSESQIVEGKAESGELTIGVRPEDLRLNTSRTEDSSFEAEVYVVEPLGSSTLVDIKVGKDILKATVQGPFKTKVGEKIWVGFLPGSIRIFDGKSGVLLI